MSSSRVASGSLDLVFVISGIIKVSVRCCKPQLTSQNVNELQKRKRRSPVETPASAIFNALSLTQYTVSCFREKKKMFSLVLGCLL